MLETSACFFSTCLAWAPPALAKETIKIGAILGVTGEMLTVKNGKFDKASKK